MEPDDEAAYRELAQLVPPNDVLLRWAARCSKAPGDLDATDDPPADDPLAEPK